MSKKLTRSGVAFTTVLAFGLTGLTGVAPANAAAGDVVSVEPTYGTGWGQFNTDTFSVSVFGDTDTVTYNTYDRLALELTQADSEAVTIDVGYGGAYYDYYYPDWIEDGAGPDVDLCEVDIPVTYSNGVQDDYETTVTISEAVADVANSWDEDSDCAFLNEYPLTIPFANVDGNGIDYTSAAIGLYDSDTINFDDGINFDIYAPLDDANSSVGIAAWIDTDSDLVRDDSYQSTLETVKFYEPKNVSVTTNIERFAGSFTGEDSNSELFLNGEADDEWQIGAGFSLQFAPALNLDQVDLDDVDVGFSKDGGDFTSYSYSTSEDGEDFWEDGAIWSDIYLSGNDDHSTSGKIYGYLDVDYLDAGASYRVKATVGNGGKSGISTGFKVQEQSTSNPWVESTELDSLTPAVDAGISAGNVSLRAGTKSFTFNAVSYDDNDELIAKSDQVLAYVYARDLAKNSTITVGSKVLKEGQAVVISANSNGDGEFGVNITSSSAKAGELYDVQFFSLDMDGYWDASQYYYAEYEASAATSVSPSVSVLAGANPTVKFTVKDQFDQKMSATTAGDALVIKAISNDGETVEEYLPVTAGVATLTFANYVAKGESDSITYELGTGGTASAFEGLGVTDTLAVYNPEAAAAINADEVIENKSITYDEFIIGTATSTNVAPDSSFEYSGTVVDAAGQGIPGSVVVIKGAGLQFQETDGDFYKDSITVATDNAGVYTVNVWAHKVSSTGINIVATASGKSATTKLTTVHNNTTQTADDLVFTWNAPKHPAVDTTYIVSAKVADVWGNPIKGATVDFEADGALEVNGDISVPNKATNSSGIARVYVRSVLKADGVGSLTATLDDIAITGLATAVTGGDDFDPVLTTDLTVGKDGTAKSGKKSGVLRVTSWNAKGKTVKVYVNDKLKATRVAALSTNLFKVHGLSAGAKTVKVVVGGGTFFNESVTIK